jgi:thioredoxin 1
MALKGKQLFIGIDFMVLTITKDNFDKEVICANGKVVVDFWAEWCGPCMMLSPLVDEVAKEMPSVKFCKVNCDDDRELALEFGINAIPCLLVFENGEIINQSIGLVEKQDIIDLVK